MGRPDYVQVAHPSDVGFDVWSTERATLYADAVLAYYDMLVGLVHIEPQEVVTLEVEGSDDEDLMVALLSECLILSETRELLFSEAEVEALQGHRLRMVLRGERIDPERHAFDLAVKAITYHQLHVGQEEDGRWHARVIVDI